jgi:hypothetical protein
MKSDSILPTILLCIILLCGSLSARAAPVVFDLEWSGASFGNGATATGQITVDDALLTNPGSNDSLATAGLVTAFTITVSGATTGDGTFTLGDFSRIILNTGTLPLDFTAELVDQPTDNDPWGTSQPGDTGGDFNLFNSSPAAPNGTFYFELTTDAGAGDKMLLTSFRPARPGTTIGTADRFAWGENIGWTDWRYDAGAPGKGAVIGQYLCSGFIWGENVGWIQLGTGAPADGVHYANSDAADYGVNHDGAGSLTGLAWGENIGWITFDQTVADPPRIDLATGQLSGYAYGENVGWIDLGGNGTHFVKTETIDAGPDVDLDMIADAWELEQAAGAGLAPALTHLDKTSDRDGDSVSDFEEYLADSDPFDGDDYLQFLSAVRDLGAETVDLEWTSSPRRVYDLYSTINLSDFPPGEGGITPDSGTSTARTAPAPVSDVRRFWQVRARPPLTP